MFVFLRGNTRIPSIVYQPFSASESMIPVMCLNVLDPFHAKYGDYTISGILMYLMSFRGFTCIVFKYNRTAFNYFLK